MKLVPSLLVFAIAGGVVLDAAAGQKARPDPMAVENIPTLAPLALQQTKAQYDRIVGVCETIEGVGGGGLTPSRALQNYFSILEKKVITGTSTVTVLEMPKHGELVDRGTMVNRGGKLVDSGEKNYLYSPESGYLGEDRVVFMVEMAGMKVKMVYSLHATAISDDEVEGNYCPAPYERQKQ